MVNVPEIPKEKQAPTFGEMMQDLRKENEELRKALNTAGYNCFGECKDCEKTYCLLHKEQAPEDKWCECEVDHDCEIVNGQCLSCGKPIKEEKE